MKTIRLHLFFALLLISAISFAQNLVPNPSFETRRCVVNYNSLPTSIPETLDDWYSCTGASPDPFDTCGTSFRPSATRPPAYPIVVPDILFGYQYAHTGYRFMGFGFYSGWYEYIGNKLTEPLKAGETYHVSYWVSCGDLMSAAADEIGIYFSTSEIKYPGTNTYGGMLNYTPQIINAKGNFLKDTTWQQLSGDFVAAGGEQWIVIGYFKPIVAANFSPFPVTETGKNAKANPNYKIGTGGTGGTARAYYYIDDVEVSQVVEVTPVKLASFDVTKKQNEVSIAWSTTTETNNCRFEVERSDNGNGFHTIATLEGARNSNALLKYSYTDNQPVAEKSYYRLRQIDCDGKSSYSKTVLVNFATTEFSIQPNPAKNTVVISRNNAGAATVNVYDFSGRKLLTQKITAEKETIGIAALQPGTYLIKLENANGVFARKIVKQ